MISSQEVDALYSLWVGQRVTTWVRQPDQHRLYDSATLQLETADLHEVLEQLASSLQLSVAVHARDYLFVHAGVVGWQGRAIVIPGSSFSGKTELVAALVRAGATYYSDEFAVFDQQAYVHPYPKPISLRHGNGVHPTRYPVEHLGGHTGDEPLPVGVIVLSQYEPEARWHPRVLSPAEALLGLLEHTVLVRDQPERSLTILERAASGALTLASERGEATELIQPLLHRGGAQALKGVSASHF